MPSASFSYRSTNQRGGVNTGMSRFENELRTAANSFIFVLGRTLFGSAFPDGFAMPLKWFLVQNFMQGHLCGEVLFAATVLIRRVRDIFWSEGITKGAEIILMTAYMTAAQLLGNTEQAETMFELGRVQLRDCTTRREVEDLGKIMINSFMAKATLSLSA